MSFSSGIVGLPNVGKSSLFNILTDAEAEASNYPFCTIDPNIGIATVPDSRLNALAENLKISKIIPATIRFVDIAGLVPGASRGEGLGNQFLSFIREVDTICHLVRLFSDDNIIRSGSQNPVADLEVIETELALKDLETLEKRKEKLTKKVRSQADSMAKKESEVIEAMIQTISQGQQYNSNALNFTTDQSNLVESFQLLTIKPAFVVANMDEDLHLASPEYQALSDFCQKRRYPLLPLSMKIEEEISKLEDESEKIHFLNDFGLDCSGLDGLIRLGYRLLGLDTFFTVANTNEVRAWTVPHGCLAPRAAGKIHSDFERGFIKAEVLSFADFIQYQGFQAARHAGKIRLEGKDYTIQDGDIIEFKFNVS